MYLSYLLFKVNFGLICINSYLSKCYFCYHITIIFVAICVLWDDEYLIKMYLDIILSFYLLETRKMWTIAFSHLYYMHTWGIYKLSTMSGVIQTFIIYEKKIMSSRRGRKVYYYFCLFWIREIYFYDSISFVFPESFFAILMETIVLFYKMNISRPI